MLNSQYGQATFTRKICDAKSQSIVEIRFSAGEAGEILAVFPQVSLNSCEVSSGRINYSARLIVTAVYADGEGKLCRVQKGAEFSHFADGEDFAPAQRALCNLNCERTQVKKEGSSQIVAVVVGEDISVFGGASRSFCSAIEGAICKTEQAKTYTAVLFSGESEVEDDFDCNAQDVLIPSATANILACTAKAGGVEVSGEIYLSMLAVRASSPVALDRIIPFKCEIACEDAVLERQALCRAEVGELSVIAKVDEQRGTCGVEFSASLRFEGLFFEEEQVSIVTDAFSPDNEVALTYAEETCAPCSEIKNYSERVSGLCATKSKLDYGCTFLAATLPHAEWTKSDSGIEGSVGATLVYEQGGEIKATTVTLPISVPLQCEINNSVITVAVCGVSIRQRSEGECEAEAVLKISVSERAEKCVRYIADAAEGAQIVRSTRAISVYLPSAGDGLWETAKKLKAPPEDIERANPDLSFPLSGKERILVYRPKEV